MTFYDTSRRNIPDEMSHLHARPSEPQILLSGKNSQYHNVKSSEMLSSVYVPSGMSALSGLFVIHHLKFAGYANTRYVSLGPGALRQIVKETHDCGEAETDK